MYFNSTRFFVSLEMTAFDGFSFRHYIKMMERSDTITLGILAHFRHFRHSKILGTRHFKKLKE
jgi:hypothetical protein